MIQKAIRVKQLPLPQSAVCPKAKASSNEDADVQKAESNYTPTVPDQCPWLGLWHYKPSPQRGWNRSIPGADARFFLFSILIFFIAIANEAQGHNRRSALAVHLEGIVIDGDLSDWPEDLPVYRIRDNTDAYGPTDLTEVNLDTSEDFSPEFMVGYSTEKQLLYVAIRARDDVIGEMDGCEVYLSAHGAEKLFQSFTLAPRSETMREEYTPELSIFRSFGFYDMLPGVSTRIRQNLFKKSGWQLATSIVGDTVIYEWALIPLKGASIEKAERILLEPGLRLAFDVTAQDKDSENDAQAWVAWSPMGMKDRNKVGDLILLEEGLPSVSGTVLFRKERIPVANYEVWLQKIQRETSAEEVPISLFQLDSDSVITAFTGPEGNFDIKLFPGTYRIYAACCEPVDIDIAMGQDITGLKLVATDRCQQVDSNQLTNSNGLQLEFEDRYGDNLTWANKDLSESGWLHPYSKDTTKGVKWIRIPFDVDRTLVGIPLALAGVGSPNDTDTVSVFQNGKLIWTSDQKDYKPDTNLPILLSFSGDRSQVLAIRRAALDTQAVQSWDRLRLYEANKKISEEVYSIRYFTGIGFLWLGIPLTITLLHLILFVFYPKAKENFYYSLFTCSVVVGVALLMLARSYFVLYGWWFEIVGPLVVFLLMTSWLKLIYALFPEDNPRFFSVWFSFALIVPVVLAADLLFRTQGPFHLPGRIPDEDVVPFLIFSFGALLLISGILFMLFRHTTQWAWRTWAICLPFCLAIVFYYGIFRLVVLLCIILVISFFAEYIRVLIVSLKRSSPGAKIVGAGTLSLLGLLFGGIILEDYYGNDIGVYICAIASPFALLSSISIHLARQFGYTNRSLEERVVQVQELSTLNLEQERSLRVRMEQELEEARQLQISLLPTTQVASMSFEVGWHMKTATEVGGDYYDYRIAADDRLTLVLGDATGHGMQAGTLVIATKSLFQSLTGEESLAATVAKMSQNLKSMNLNQLGMALTMVELEGRHMRYCPAGIPPLLIYRSRENKIVEGQTGGLPLGLTTLGSYQEAEVILDPGDTVLLMSDGLPERTNEREKEFGYQRAQELFHKLAGETPNDICRLMAAGGDEWAGGRVQDDDVTFLALRVR